MRGILFGLLVTGLVWSVRADTGAGEIRKAMRKAAGFYHGKVAWYGGYVYYTSADFSRRLGEGVVEESQIWVQPPATPSVAEAFLSANEVTWDEFYLLVALDAGKALLHGQVESGGWTNAIDFDSKGARAARYRNGKGKKKGRNFSTLDDDSGQSALRFFDEAG